MAPMTRPNQPSLKAAGPQFIWDLKGFLYSEPPCKATRTTPPPQLQARFDQDKQTPQ
jgi:hypothetical protein